MWLMRPPLPPHLIPPLLHIHMVQPSRSFYTTESPSLSQPQNIYTCHSICLELSSQAFPRDEVSAEISSSQKDLF